jgi:hypothetical protein
VIVLRGGATLARIDPAHGAEVLDLVDLRTGRQLLGRPPFGSLPPLGGELDEQQWSERWRGGWQTCFPNFGAACAVGELRHGFHGRASNDPWTVEEIDASRATLSWRGHGLRAVKRLAAAGGEGDCALRLETTLEAERDSVPAIALEHLALGLELIEPEARLELPAGRAFELDADLGPVEPPAAAASWPEIRLLDDGLERGDVWTLRDEDSRLFALSAVAEGRARVINPARGQTVELEWDVDRLPHLVVWREARGSGGLWRNATEVLCLEPCSVSHEAGLSAAAASGGAWQVRPGEPISWWVSVRSLP